MNQPKPDDKNPLLLIAIRVRPDEDISQPIRQLLDAIGIKDGPPAHVNLLTDLTDSLTTQLASIFAPSNPSAFQTLADLTPKPARSSGAPIMVDQDHETDASGEPTTPFDGNDAMEPQS